MSIALHRWLRSGSARAGWIACLAVLFLGSQFVAVHHASAVLHKHCVEHGRLEHVAHDAHEGPGHSHDGPELRALPEPEHAGDPHEGCALEACLSERAPHAPMGALFAGPAPAEVRSEPVEADLRRSPIALLRLAPKQSPPV